MVKKRFRHLLLCLAVLLMLPLWNGAAAAAESTPDAAASRSASTTGGAEVSNFYNVIMQVGADPWVYKHTDGYYYNVYVNASGIMIRRAKTITGIDSGERSLAWTPVKDTMYSSNVWAPEMHYLEDTDGTHKWYIYFAADNGTNANHRMYVLENASADPMTGTWAFKGKITDSTDRWAIDGTVLTVNDKPYFIWSGWEETDGSFQNLYIAEMSDPRTISSERVLISTPEHDWETSPARINEGPQVNIRGNTINLVYSANGSWTDSYCLGLITANIGDDLTDPDSWVKRDEPIFSSANGVYGPGHHSLTTSPDGSEDWMIYHSARWSGSGWTRNVRAQQFTWNADGTPNLGEPADPNTPIALPSGEPARQRYEAETALLVKDPSGEIGPSVWRDRTASGGMKIANMKNANDSVQFTVNVPEAGFYMLSVRNANGSSSGTDASHMMSVNGGPGARLSIVYSGWDRWGASTAKVYLKEGDNKIRFSVGANMAVIDSMDVFKLEVASELLFDSPGYTLGLGESRSLPVYTLTGTASSPVDNGVSFQSSKPEVAAIEGMAIKGLAAGSATITATYNGQSATAAVTVSPEPKSVQSVAISGLNNVLTSGSTGQLQVTARYNTYEEQDVTASAAYVSSNPAAAKVTVTGQVYDTAPGDTVITSTYGGKEAEFNLTVTPDPSQVPQVVSQVKTPSGVTPRLPGVVDVVYNGEEGNAEVSWKLEGIHFNSLDTVQVPVVLTLNDEEISAVVAVEVVPGWGLDDLVKQVRYRIDSFSYPLGEGLGNYSQAAYDALLAQLNHAEERSADGSLTEEQFNQERSSLAGAEADLLGSLISTQDGVFYNAYRDFSGDETGKYPFGITVENLTNGAAAAVQEEDGNKFLRLTTTATAGKANLFLPFLGEVTATGDKRIIIEYRARLNSSFQYANGAMVRNDSGANNFSMVTAFDMGKIVVQNGPSNKVKVQDFQYHTWYKFRMEANWDAKTYTVYLNDDPVPVAADFTFRHTGGNKLTGQRFGIDGYANASIDYDDFKVMVIGGEKAAPEGVGKTDETAAGANDGRITGVNASMEWSSDNGSTWSSVEGDTIANLSPGTYWVRYKETDTHQASPHVELTLAAYNQPGGGTGGGSGGSSDPTVPATTIKNEDGSTTTIVTDQTTGTVTETTTWPNGDRKVVTKERDGVVTELVTGQDGSKREVVTKPDGSSRSVVTDALGVKVETVTTALGEVTADVHLPEGVAQARITIPVKKATASTVAYTALEDGSRTIIGDSVLTEDGLSFFAKGDMTVRLIDNEVSFNDVPDDYWAAEAIAFAASRELFLGTEQGVFAPDASMSRAMLFTVLARLDGAETEGGASWYSKSQDWAADAGISDGSAPEAAITREQLITLLHRYAGQAAANGNGNSKSFADSGEISAWAREAMGWAVETGILNGKPGNLLAPAGAASRAEVSAMLARFIAWRNN
ncbi:family 43 glycosylhydrolase [Paenibacillus arenilitoris]|uniref:Family 43 glycosylhydrolase n=1 Tax=Paenibacillus arenilitoris TaxID=2772299 RepID=A0A927H5H8_9BACL|nr:family 43 glycosylhydrolase [Paenibacillus arenilitoris]MBD2868970.1 family 43 glycosylhydrolase [Paenibacillus arenilitoris]